MTSSLELATIGHGTDDRASLGERLQTAGIERLVDVRRFPGSRRHEDVRREELQRWVPEAGVTYRWDARLGGRRRLDPTADVADPWWRVVQFRAYAAHTRTPEFEEGLDELLADAVNARTAVMCSESVWWRCHRRLVADVAVLLHGVRVTHLMPGGRATPHEPSPGARVVGREVFWDQDP